jgi:hypothetical protein
MGIRANRWIAPPSSLELKHDEIHFWRADLDRYRYIVARGALRTILARYLKTTPGSLVFSYGLEGKPELAGGGLRFNVSRSQGLALFAIRRARELWCRLRASAPWHRRRTGHVVALAAAGDSPARSPPEIRAAARLLATSIRLMTSLPTGATHWRSPHEEEMPAQVRGMARVRKGQPGPTSGQAERDPI